MRLGMRSQLAMVVAIAAALPLSLGLFSVYFLGWRYFRAEKGALYQTMAIDLSGTLAEAILTQVASFNTWVVFGSLADMVEASESAETTDQGDGLNRVAQQLDAEWPDLDSNDEPLRTILTNDFAVELRRFQRDHPLFAEILLTDEYGNLVAATNKTSDFYQGDERWWQAAQLPMQQAQVRGIDYDISAGVHALEVTVPLRPQGTRANSAPTGVIKAVVNVGPLLEAVARTPLPEHPRMHVVMDDGRILANLSPQRGGLQLGDSFPTEAVERLRLPSSGWRTMVLDGDSPQLVGFARLRPPRVTAYLDRMPPRNTDDDTTVGTSASVGLTGLMPAYVLAHENLDTVMAPIANQLRLLALLGLLLVVCFATVALWLADRRITRPLRLLRQAAQSIADEAHLSSEPGGKRDSARAAPRAAALIEQLKSIDTTDEMEDLSRDFGLMGQRVLSYHEQLEKEITLKNEEIQRDLEMAREFQEALLPREYPTVPAEGISAKLGLTFSHLYKPAFLVGGDFFNVARLSDTVAAVFVADVIGHGARSALITAILRTLLQDLSADARDPETLLTTMNAHFHRLMPHRHDCIFVTACYLVIDTRKQTVAYASAGHPPPLLIDSEQQQAVELLTGHDHDPALGLFPDTQFRAGSTAIAPGQSLLLYTDGVIEASNPAEEMYGVERLREDTRAWLEQRDVELTAYIIQRINAFLGTTTADDDICMVAVNVTEPPPSKAPSPKSVLKRPYVRPT